MKTKRIIEKKDLVNVFLSIIVGLGIYYIFKIINASTETWFSLITILILFIYFKLLDKNRK